MFLWKLDQPFGLDLFRYFEQIAQKLVKNVERLFAKVFLQLVKKQQGDLVHGGDSFHPESFGLGVFDRKQYVDDGMGVIEIFQIDGVFADEKHDDGLEFGAVVLGGEFGDGLDVGEEVDDFAGHFFVRESQVDDVLQEGEEDEGGGD